jgi:hypothetical protein
MMRLKRIRSTRQLNRLVAILEILREATSLPPGLDSDNAKRFKARIAARRGWTTRRSKEWAAYVETRERRQKRITRQTSRQFEQLHRRVSLQIEELATQVADGRITSKQFQSRVKKILKPAYEECARLGKARGRGEYQALSAGDLKAVGRERSAEHKFLRDFAADIDGKYASLPAEERLAKIQWRAGMYADALAGEMNISEMYHRPDDMDARWKLAPAEHCRQCIDYAGMGWKPVPFWRKLRRAPGDGHTTCRTNCKCAWEYRTPDRVRATAKGIVAVPARGLKIKKTEPVVISHGKAPSKRGEPIILPTKTTISVPSKKPEAEVKVAPKAPAKRPQEDVKIVPGKGSAKPSVTKPVKLNLQERQSLEYYTSDGFLNLNKNLREGKKLGPSDTKYVERIDSALSKLPAHSSATYRKLDFPSIKDAEAFVKSHQPGQVATYNQYISTSQRSDIFGLGGKESVKLTIHGKNGRDISSYSTNPGEKEVLFKPGTSFTVKSVTEEQFGQMHIVLEEV